MKASVETGTGRVEYEFSAFVIDPQLVMGLCQVSLTVLRRPPATPSIFDKEMAHLRLRVPGFPEEFEPVADCGVTAEKAEAVFDGGELAQRPLPTEVEVLWCKDGQQSLGIVACSPAPATRPAASEPPVSKPSDQIREGKEPKKPWWRFW